MPKIESEEGYKHLSYTKKNPSLTNRYADTELFAAFDDGIDDVQRVIAANRVYAENYGAQFNGTTNDQAAIQAALNAGVSAAQSSGAPSVVELPAGKVARINSGITVDLRYVSLLGNRTFLDFSSQTSGKAVTITGSAPAPFENITGRIEGIRISGNSNSGNVSGLYVGKVAASGTGGPSHVTGFNLGIDHFGKGIEFGDNSYNDHFVNVDVWDCGELVSYPTTVDQSNAGEGYKFTGCHFFNGAKGVAVNGGGFSFYGCSFDYNTIRQFEVISPARVWLYGCWIEQSRNTSTSSPIYLSGAWAHFYMSGGRMIMPDSATATSPYIVEMPSVDAITGGAYFHGVAMAGLRTTNDRFNSAVPGSYVERCPKVNLGTLKMPEDTPTIAAGAGLGTGATATITGTAKAGYITLTSGTGTAAGIVADITLPSYFYSAPRVFLWPANANAAQKGYATYIERSSLTNTFVRIRNSFDPFSASSVYEFHYKMEE